MSQCHWIFPPCDILPRSKDMALKTHCTIGWKLHPWKKVSACSRNINRYSIICTMYKILKNTFSFPENIINFRSRFQTHPMSTRHLSANSLHIPHAHTNSFMNSFVLSTSTLWNGLPSVITCLSTFHTFKKYLKTFMFS